jgi:hypothetical protein
MSILLQQAKLPVLSLPGAFPLIVNPVEVLFNFHSRLNLLHNWDFLNK